jgi:uncharacterized protein YneF (UPF0154 family)
MPAQKWLYLAAGVALGMFVVPKVMARIGG